MLIYPIYFQPLFVSSEFCDSILEKKKLKSNCDKAFPFFLTVLNRLCARQIFTYTDFIMGFF
jgi:hypothetical protein